MENLLQKNERSSRKNLISPSETMGKKQQIFWNSIKWLSTAKYTSLHLVSALNEFSQAELTFLQHIVLRSFRFVRTECSSEKKKKRLAQLQFWAWPTYVFHGIVTFCSICMYSTMCKHHSLTANLHNNEFALAEYFFCMFAFVCAENCFCMYYNLPTHWRKSGCLFNNLKWARKSSSRKN